MSCSNSDLDKLSSLLKEKKTNAEISPGISINKKPIAVIQINDDLRLIENEKIDIDGKSSYDEDGKIVSYLWKDGDKIIGNTDTISVKLISGIHIIELTVEDDKGSKGFIKKIIKVELDFSKIKIDLSSIEEIAVLRSSSKNINDISIYNNYLYGASDDGNIYIWELVFNELLSPKILLAHKDYEVSSILAINDKIYSGSNDNSIKIWDIGTRKPLKTIKNHSNTITSIIGDDNLIIFSSLDKKISVISAKSNNIIKTLISHKSPVIALSIIERYIISYSQNKEIKLWDTKKDYKNISTIDLVNGEVDFMKRYKNKIITSSKDGFITIRDVFNNSIIKEIKSSPIKAMDIYNNLIILALSNKNIISINIDSLEIKNILTTKHKATSIRIKEGIMAVGLEDQSIKIFGNKIQFEKR